MHQTHRLHPLAYPADPADYFAPFAAEPWAMFLDSGRPHGGRGRYDLICATPHTTLVTRGLETCIRGAAGERRSAIDPLHLLAGELRSHTPFSLPAGWPFGGGAVGYFAYDLARRFERLPAQAEDDLGLPEMAVGLYDWAIVIDHEARRAAIIARPEFPEAGLRGLVERLRGEGRAGTPLHPTAPIASNMDRATYAAAFARIQHYLREGDCYQVNLAQRFAAPAEGDPWAAYRGLRRANPAPFGAYLHLPGTQVLSCSPERFLRVDAEAWVQTRPIKGTRPRVLNPEADRAAAAELRQSPKDRAENLMIVDLLRNDLGRCCRPGSVRVPELFALESFATVHHLVSTVEGRLAAGQDATDLLRACLPGGSITGAPKLRAMEIIEELEPHRRGIYCGNIGYLGYDGAMDTSIAIRTAVHTHGRLSFAAGGGIVVDSDCEAEYAESLAKARAFLDFWSHPA